MRGARLVRLIRILIVVHGISDVSQNRLNVIRKRHVLEVVLNLRLDIGDDVVQLVRCAFHGCEQGRDDVAASAIFLFRWVELIQEIVNDRCDTFDGFDDSSSTWWIRTAGVRLKDGDDADDDGGLDVFST